MWKINKFESGPPLFINKKRAIHYRSSPWYSVDNIFKNCILCVSKTWMYSYRLSVGSSQYSSTNWVASSRSAFLPGARDGRIFTPHLTLFRLRYTFSFAVWDLNLTIMSCSSSFFGPTRWNLSTSSIVVVELASSRTFFTDPHSH